MINIFTDLIEKSIEVSCELSDHLYDKVSICAILIVCICRDKTTINFQYIYHIAFLLLENSTTLRAQNKCQIQID